MQPLTADPRDGLTEAQVVSLLESPSLTVDFGAELLDSDLVFVEDISDDLAGGTVSRRMHTTVHGTCRLALSRQLAWGNDLVRLYMTLADGTVEARWNVGVFALTTPDRKVGESPETYDVQGYDRLHLLQRQVGADYTVTAGTTYRQALEDAFTAAGLSGVLIEGAAADDTLPADKTWALVPDDESDPDQTDTPVTWLRVVNDLLQAINFRGVWADQDGIFRCEGYLAPSVRAVEWTFDADDVDTIVGADRTVSEDVWAAPNKWVFRWKNGGTGVEGDGVYTVDESDTTNGDRLGRTLVWTSVIDYEAASQAKLVELGDRRVAADKRVTSRLEVTTGPMPGAGHADVFSYVDVELGGPRKVTAVEWEMPLDGGDVTWRWETV